MGMQHQVIKVIRTHPQDEEQQSDRFYHLYILLDEISAGQQQQLLQMSSYIIAGSAESIDTAYCEEIARRIKAKYKNIDFRVVIKHPSEWEDYLQQICRIYGFLNKSNPIVYTFDGKIIGNKDAFLANTSKYFGLPEEQLIVPNLTNKVNIKLADEELRRKNILKNNLKTISQKIHHKHHDLLKNGLLAHEFQSRQQFLVKGIEYSFNEVEGICSNLNFPLHKQVEVKKEDVRPENIDLLALSLTDQIKPEDGTGKEAFVTNNQQVNTDSMEKMSDASRTNRLHSSVMSRDGDSKAKEENQREKQKIDEEYDDVADFTDHNMEEMAVCEIGDGFFLAFEKAKNTRVEGEMLLYFNESQNNGNAIRIYNDGRSVIGHRNLIKEIHYIGKVEEEQKEDQEKEEEEKEGEEEEEKGDEILLDKPQEDPPKEEPENVNVNEKSKTEPNIPEHTEAKEEPKEEENLSEPYSDLNLVSNLNYHTLYINRPLSQPELKHLLYLIRDTDTVSCLQFLPENPNPKIKVYSRKLLLGSEEALFPVEKFLLKQLEDEEFEDVTLPLEPEENAATARVKKINDLGYNHFYIEHDGETNDESLAKHIKLAVEELLSLEEQLNKEIGYNLIFSRKFTLLVALAEPYKVYGSASLYFDGLAFLGYLQIAKVVDVYKIKSDAIKTGEGIRSALARSSGLTGSD